MQINDMFTLKASLLEV